MGVYVYSLRKYTVGLLIPGEARYQRVKANLYSYAYKLHSPWPGDYGYRGYKLTEENTVRRAKEAWDTDRSGIVIMGDVGQLEGRSVYKDITAPLYYDTENFPGTQIGWVGPRRNGTHGTYTLTDRTEWTHGKLKDGEQWVPFRSMSIMEDGKPKYIQEILPGPSQDGGMERLAADTNKMLADMWDATGNKA